MALIEIGQKMFAFLQHLFTGLEPNTNAFEPFVKTFIVKGRREGREKREEGERERRQTERERREK